MSNKNKNITLASCKLAERRLYGGCKKNQAVYIKETKAYIVNKNLRYMLNLDGICFI
jgi:hypothetical protein